MKNNFSPTHIRLGIVEVNEKKSCAENELRRRMNVSLESSAVVTLNAQFSSATAQTLRHRCLCTISETFLSSFLLLSVYRFLLAATSALHIPLNGDFRFDVLLAACGAELREKRENAMRIRSRILIEGAIEWFRFASRELWKLSITSSLNFQRPASFSNKNSKPISSLLARQRSNPRVRLQVPCGHSTSTAPNNNVLFAFFICLVCSLPASEQQTEWNLMVY